jgi:hypothetical protein
MVIISIYLLDFSKPKVSWGVTFSQEYAQNELGLDWKMAYLAILDDLKVDHLRLSAYWNQVEGEKDKFDYNDLDWQVAEASQRNVKIILAVGRRLPRWPECHDPSWLASSTQPEIEAKQLAFVESVVKRYDSNPNIIYFQVENEPFLKFFGKCPPLNKELLKQEIKLVKSLSSKPVLITDSGELSSWLEAGNSGADLLGTTLYRTVYNPQFGYFRWFLPPVFYSAKAGWLKVFSPMEKVIVAELQTEAWHKENRGLRDMTLSENSESMSLKQFKSNIIFTRRAGFAEVYLWGVEWWYYLKEQRSEDSFWQEAKKLWQ